MKREDVFGAGDLASNPGFLSGEKWLTPESGHRRTPKPNVEGKPISSGAFAIGVFFVREEWVEIKPKLPSLKKCFVHKAEQAESHFLD